MRKSGKKFWDFMPRTIVGLGLAMLYSGQSMALSANFTAYSCTLVDCDSVSSFNGTTTTNPGCDDAYAFDLCFRLIPTSGTITSNYKYYKIRSCRCQGSAIGTTVMAGGGGYTCPSGSGVSYNSCTCSGAGGACETDDDCSTAWGTSYNDIPIANTTGYQVRGKSTCTNSCSCTSKLAEYRCAAGYYGTPSCTIQTATSFNPTRYICTGCTQCPAIVDSATNRQIYTDSTLSSVAYGTSVATTGAASGICYWAAGTYYDSAGTITINSGTSYSTCGYDE